MIKNFLLCCLLTLPAAAQKWAIQYFFDEMRQEMEITDLAFPTAERGIAAGAVYDKMSGRERYVSLTSADGGAHWSMQSLKEYPRSIYFLNDSLGWMVTDRGVWFTEESGRTWKKLCEQIKPDKNLEPETTIGLLLRVWFLDEKHGFGVGLQKTIVETKDGGRTWTALPFMHGKSVRALAMAPSDSRTLVAGALDGIFRSRDGIFVPTRR